MIGCAGEHVGKLICLLHKMKFITTEARQSPDEELVTSGNPVRKREPKGSIESRKFKSVDHNNSSSSNILPTS